MSDQIASRQLSFEQIKHTENGVEFWLARELMPLLGYSKWENFSKVIEKAKVACQESGFKIDDQFPDVRNVASKRLIC